MPYSPYLLNKYECHTNVEAVTNIDVIKYVYKYIYKVRILLMFANIHKKIKGYDRALVNFVDTFDVTADSKGVDSTGLNVHQVGKGKCFYHLICLAIFLYLLLRCGYVA